ncbi:MAG: hypothetical protein K6D98_01280 [Clostridiales bacterium]|nr:hypothetical protein [Clostridiales bacterium]
MKKCPKCGSNKTASIVYGLISPDEETKRALENHEIILGGCCISDEDPKFYCFDCAKEFGTPPFYTDETGVFKKDLRETVTSVYFSYGGFFGGYDNFLIEKTQSGIVSNYLHLPIATKSRNPVSRELSYKEWEKLMNAFYSKMFVHEWDGEYVNYDILDGTQWSLELRLEDGSVKRYHGSNAFPPYWEELKKLFEPYFVGPSINENDKVKTMEWFIRRIIRIKNENDRYSPDRQ